MYMFNLIPLLGTSATSMYCNFFVYCSFGVILDLRNLEDLLFNFCYLSISLIFNKGLKYLDKKKFSPKKSQVYTLKK